MAAPCGVATLGASVVACVVGLGCDGAQPTAAAKDVASQAADTATANAANRSAQPGVASPTKVDLVAYTPSDEPLTTVVQRENQRAIADGRDLFIYVGAEWCEPCTRFHDAAARGELDAVFPTLRLLELDRDRDEAQLQSAGCITRLIPLFARPTSEGRCDLQRAIMGSVKGPEAVANISPRLKALLAL